MIEVTEYIKKAFEHKKNGEYKEAIDFFYKALVVENENAEIMSELALLYSKIGQYERSLSFFEQIINKNPDKHEVKFKYASLLKKLGRKEEAESLLKELLIIDYNLENLLELLFDIFLSEKRAEEIISVFEEKKANINKSTVFLKVGCAYELLNNLSKADEYYKKAYDTDKSNVEAGYYIAKSMYKESKEETLEFALELLKQEQNENLYSLIAEIYSDKGELDFGIKYYSYAINCNNKNPEYYFRLGLLFSLKGYFKEAEESYQKAISLKPLNEFYNYALAYLYYTNKKYNAAKNSIEAILDINANNLQALSLKIILLMNDNESAKAGKIIDKINDMEKDDFAYYAISIFYSKLNIWDKAIYNIKLAIVENPDSLEYKYTLAKYCEYMQNYDEALNICDEIIKSNDKYIQAYILKAKISIKRSDIKSGLENLEKAKLLDINSDEIYYLKGQIEKEQKNYKEAIDNFKTAISIMPNQYEYYAQTGECYYSLNDYNNAYIYYKEASTLNITEAKNYYYMAKCCIKKGDKEGAITNFSIMLRLAPDNDKYIKEYALYQKESGNKKEAKSIINSAIKRIKIKEIKDELKKILKEI